MTSPAVFKLICACQHVVMQWPKDDPIVAGSALRRLYDALEAVEKEPGFLAMMQAAGVEKP